MSVSPEHESQTNGTIIENPSEFSVRSRSYDDTLRLGSLLGELLLPGDIILLQGDLGTGKTAFTQGIGRGLGVSTTINSPTFTILKEYYAARLPLYHFDLYRIEEPEELFMLGFDDYFSGDGVCVVEWAERAETEGAIIRSPWPGGYLRVQLYRISANQRSLVCTANGNRGHILLAAFVRGAAMNGVA